MRASRSVKIPARGGRRTDRLSLPLSGRSPGPPGNWSPANGPRHPVVRRVLAVSRVLLHVSDKYGPLPAKSRAEQVRGARHREMREGFARHAGERVEHVGAALLVIDVIEKGAEVSADKLGRGIGD